MRILEVINRTTPFFDKQGIESPRLNIELLLAHLLRKKRLELYLEFERELEEPLLEKLREMVRRRAAGEPLQYIVGEAEFCGRRFVVDRRVLIPRPETELLVQTVLNRLQPTSGASTIDHPPFIIVDVGTGSGCIAVTLASERLDAQIYAVDASADALQVAALNARRHGVEKNIRFLRGDLLSVLPDSLRAESIVSNPPYVATGELAKLPKEVRDFEPVEALVAGDDGLAVFRRLIEQAHRSLSPSGFLVFELGDGQRPAVADLLAAHGYQVAQVVLDLQGQERVIVAQALNKPE